MFSNTLHAMKKFVKRLAVMATYFDPSLDIGRQGDMMGPEFDRELDVIKNLGHLDIAPTTVLSFKNTGRSQQLVCEGFTLTNK